MEYKRIQIIFRDALKRISQTPRQVELEIDSREDGLYYRMIRDNRVKEWKKETVYHGNNCFFRRMFYSLCETYQTHEIEIHAADPDEEVIQDEFSLEEIHQMTKHYDKNLIPEDEDDMEYDHTNLIYNLFDRVVDNYLIALRFYGKMNKVRKEIEGQNCPVTHEPLTLNDRKYVKCGHLISEEAFIKMAKLDGHNCRKCPLCRQESHAEYLVEL